MGTDADATMRAWQVTRLGEPQDVLELRDVPRPAARAGHRILNVDACALNFPDVLLCRGQYQARPELPFIPGLEVCGTDPETGIRYAALPVSHTGGLSAQVSVPLHAMFEVPPDMPVATAAGFAVTYQTGYAGLHRRARLQEGETLLVHAGAGGVGSAAIQLGLAAGARVIATAGGPDKVAVCRALGADLAVDYLQDDFVAVVNDATDGRGADVIYDSVGGETFTRSTKCIAFEGRIVVVGFAGGTIAQAATNHVLVKNYAVLGLHWGLYRDRRPDVVPPVHDALVELWRTGAVNPLVAAELPFGQAPEGLRRLAARETVGKVIVAPPT